MRSRSRRGERVFKVDLIVHQLDSIPEIHRLLYVHWKARRAIPPEGRTPSLPVARGNRVQWNSDINFVIAIPPDPADPTILQPTPLVLQLRSERRARWLGTTSFQAEGVVEVDLSETAAAGYVARNFLVQDSLLNTTLKLTIRVTHQSGDKIFRTRALAAPSVASTHDDTALDDDSTGTLPTLSRDLSLRQLMPSAEGRVERSTSAPFDRSMPGISLSSLPGIPKPCAAQSSATMLSVDGNEHSSSAFAFNNTHESPSSVLDSSIPIPEVVQSRVYEDMFQAQLRDEWPPHIVASRVNAVDTVNEIYADVCAADGIGLAGSGAGTANVPEVMRRHASERPRPDKTLSLEVLIESRNETGAQGPKIGQAPLVRRLSAKSPRSLMRSSSMGELAQLDRLNT